MSDAELIAQLDRHVADLHAEAELLEDEILTLTDQVDRCRSAAAKFTDAIAILRGDTPPRGRRPGRPPAAGIEIPSARRQGPQRPRAAAPEADQDRAGGLEGTPAKPHLDKEVGRNSIPAAGASHPPSTNPDPARERAQPPEPMSAELAALLALLDHPEWIEGAVLRGMAWRRADGERWTCSCGKAARTIGQMRSHMRTVVDPEAHRPDITAASTPATLEPEQFAIRESRIANRDVTRDESRDTPATNGQAADPTLPFACSCQSRFPTAHDWARHRKEQPTGARARHRLVAQPKAEMVDTGLPRPRHPSMEERAREAARVRFIEPRSPIATITAAP